MKNRITQLRASTIINTKRENVWSVVNDFGTISAFHPLVKESHALNSTQGVGAQRHCELLPMGAMDERITHWNEGHSLTSEVTGGKMLPPCHFMRGILQLESLHEDQTRVTFTFQYQIKYGLMGQLLNQMMIKPQFKKAPGKYVSGLKDYMESRASNLR